jgi:hypothetical protein
MVTASLIIRISTVVATAFPYSVTFITSAISYGAAPLVFRLFSWLYLEEVAVALSLVILLLGPDGCWALGLTRAVTRLKLFTWVDDQAVKSSAALKVLQDDPGHLVILENLGA